MATGSTMTHYCDWAISILIQPASQPARQALLWEALSWLRAGSALFTVTSLPLVLPLNLPLNAFIFTSIAQD